MSLRMVPAMDKSAPAIQAIDNMPKSKQMYAIRYWRYLVAQHVHGMYGPMPKVENISPGAASDVVIELTQYSTKTGERI